MSENRAAAEAAQRAFEEWFGEAPVQRVVPTDVEGHEIWALLFDGRSGAEPEPARSSGVVSKLEGDAGPEFTESEPESAAAVRATPRERGKSAESGERPAAVPAASTDSAALVNSNGAMLDDDEDEEEETPLHFVVTAGLSAEALGPARERFELVLPVSSAVEIGELADVAQFLRAVGQVFSEPGSELDRHLLIETGEIPLFEGMSWLMITPWDPEAHEVLPGILPSVTILCATPLFAGEAMKIQQLPEGAAMAWFEAVGVDLDDPDRPDASDPSTIPSSFELTQAMSQMMAQIGAMAADMLENGTDEDDEDEADDDAELPS